MCAWQSNIPQATDKLSKSQGDLQGNNLELTTAFNQNHINLNANTSASSTEGMHMFIQLPQQGSPTYAAAAGQLGIYSQLDPATTNTELYIQRQAAYAPASMQLYSLTSSLNASPGWCRLPCGLIMKWGKSGLINYTNNGTAALATGANIPNIVTLVWYQVSIATATDLGVITYVSFDDVGAHTITALASKIFGSSNGAASFSYLVLGY